MRSPLKNILDALSATLYPASCALCKQSLLHFSSLPICESCWSAVTPQQGVLCLHCGESIGLPQASLTSDHLSSHLSSDLSSQLSLEDRLCDLCQTDPAEFAQAVAYGVYENELRGLIHLMKYEGLLPIAARLGERLAAVVAELPIAPGTDVLVVPVPLYRSKQRQRGFNHAERIAHALTQRLRKLDRTQGRAHRWTMARSVLRRRRPTESQARLSPQGRRRNLRHAFQVPDAAALRGREVLLVDDIYTTGATAAACTRVLLRAGAKAVWVATAARAQREGVAMWDAEAMFATASEQVGL